ncbi:MAG: anaerobic ribonucleoside-triphosphate reductase, partial [Methanosarcinaceae archaeon]|nr:anaerobic ribonucleoside-triphosphate reductase [Methanosarcinaceae archaeon]
MTEETTLSEDQPSYNPLKVKEMNENNTQSEAGLSDNQPVQKTLDGLSLSLLPKVRTTDGFIVNWDRSVIVNQLLKETRLSEVFYNKPAATREEAQEIAKDAEKLIRGMNINFLSGPLIREIVNTILLEKGHVEWRNIMTRVGTSVYDAYEIDTGFGFGAKDNANQLNNAETSHKRKADKMSKEQNLLLIPKELADLHLNGDLHIHDLEYMGTRPFCIDGSMVVPVQEAGVPRMLRLDEVPIEGNEYFPEKLNIQTPTGYRQVQKITKRPINGEELLKIKTSSGRSVLVTGEHRIPVNKEGMKIKRADEIEKGDLLYPAIPGIQLRGTPIETVDLIEELLNNVPAEYLENVYVRKLENVFKEVRDSGKAESYAEISRTLGFEYNKQWYSRGIMPIKTFALLCAEYGIKSSEYEEITIGVTGSEHDLPARFELSEEIATILGFFVSEGNYNVNDEKGTYNLAITENHQSATIAQYAETCLNSFATIYKGGVPETTVIHGVETERKRAQQVYFGGKLTWLVFRYLFKIPAGAENKRLPTVLWQFSDEALRAFLSALFTGDGSVYYRPEKSDCVVNYTTTSSTLRQELSMLLISLGMKPEIVELYEKEERKTIYRIQLNGRRNIETFSKWVSFLDERQEHIDNFLKNVKEIKVPQKEEVVTEIKTGKATGNYVYDIFLKGDGSEESHTFYTSDGLLIHNCQDWDLRYFFYYGLMPDGVGSQSSVAKPAKNAEVAFLHAVKAMGSAQTNFAGGQGFYNFLTFLAPYLEGKTEKEIRQLMQMFVYEMMQMMCARGGQTVFSSVQLSPGVPKLWKDKPIVAMGKVWNGEQAPLRTYGEFEKEVRLGFKALMDVMLEGDAWGKPFSFPKPEISIEPDFMEENEEFNKAHPDIPTYRELYRMTFELAAKFGTPYFDNQLPEYRGAGEGISCYQCLAADEFVSFAEPDGQVRIKQIGEIFEKAAKAGKETDPLGVEFAKLNGKTPSVNFDELETSLRDFKGVMRQKYQGKMLNIVLESGRRIRVTPAHPVFMLEEGKFVKKSAKRLKEGDYLPVLKETEFSLPIVSSIDIKEVLTEAGYDEELVIEEGMVNIKNAKKPGLPSHIPVTEELIRFLGYYLAEGCSDHSGRRYSVRLSFGKSEEALIEDAKMCLLAMGFDVKLSEEKTATNVVVNSKLLYLLLEALGCGHEAHSKSVPDLLFNVETSFVGTYISCSFKGDGNVNTQKGKVGKYPHNANAIRMRLVSREAVQKLIWLGQRIGIQMNYMAREETVKHPQTGEPYNLKTYTCYVTSQDQIKNFYKQTGYGEKALVENEKSASGCFTRIPIEETGLDHSKLKYPAQYRGQGHRSVNQAHVLDTSEAPMADLLINGKVHALEIKKIEEEEYNGFVYDLVEVSETHNFSNALGIVTGNCCAYQFSANPTDDVDFTDKLYFKDGKHFSMGSWMVMSLNCPRAAYKADHDDEKLFTELKSLMKKCMDIFRIKRGWMNKLIAKNRIPFASQQPKDPSTGKKGAVAVDFESLVYTIGVIGINEMVQYHTGYQMHESPEAYKLAIRAMFEMKMYAQKLSQDTGMEIALARTPAETTAQRFAVSDLLHREYAEKAEAIVQGDMESAKKDLRKTHDLPVYYTNGTHIPPGADISLVDRINYEHTFFPIVDGGNIMHIWLGEGKPDPDGLQELAMHIAKNT